MQNYQVIFKCIMKSYGALKEIYMHEWVIECQSFNFGQIHAEY